MLNSPLGISKFFEMQPCGLGVHSKHSLQSTRIIEQTFDRDEVAVPVTLRAGSRVGLDVVLQAKVENDLTHLSGPYSDKD